MLDWSDGDYELTAAELEVVARKVVELSAIGAGDRVLDLGAGTGNAAVAAAARGASVVACDPAARLLEVARRRAADAGHAVEVVACGAEALPFADASFDAVLSVFAIIFAPDPERCARELVRVLRPGGRAYLTCWYPRGAIAEAGQLLRHTLQALSGAPPAPPPPWGDPERVRELFAALPVSVTMSDATLTFGARSPAAWFDEQSAYHPVWRLAARALAERPDELRSFRDASIAALAAGNEDSAAFRATSGYFTVAVRRAAE